MLVFYLPPERCLTQLVSCVLFQILSLRTFEFMSSDVGNIFFSSIRFSLYYSHFFCFVFSCFPRGLLEKDLKWLQAISLV